MEEEKEMKNNSSPQKETTTARNGHSAINGHHCITSPQTLEEDKIRVYRKVVKYKECMKNHAASIGGNARDGCGEFMASGEEGSIEALKCSACSCHRNFHRKETGGGGGGEGFHELHHNPPFFSKNGIVLGHAYPLNSSRPTQQMIMSYKSGFVPSESDEKDDHGRLKRRFRSKFSEEQKEKMLEFAERAGWKMQKVEESMVQRFCQEVGIKRKVLKVWMHNNKQNFVKKNLSTNS